MDAPKKARSLEEIEAEIRQLQEEASAVRDAEKAVVVQRMKNDIRLYKINAQDLGLELDTSTTPTGKKSRSSSKTPVDQYKYTDGNGKFWSGRGKHPKFVKDYVAKGGEKEDLLNKDRQ